MPVKIGAPTTSLEQGAITTEGFETMMSEFKDNTDIVAKNGRSAIVKKEAWFVTREEIMELLNLNTDANGNLPELIEINFAINPDDAQDVCGNDMSNALTVVLRAATASKTPVNQGNEYVLIPGFNNAVVENYTPKSIFGAGCCPSSRP